MMANIQRQMKGYVRIRVHTVSYDRFLNICALHNLYIWDLKPVENAYEMNLSIEAFRRLKPLARKTGTHIPYCQKVRPSLLAFPEPPQESLCGRFPWRGVPSVPVFFFYLEYRGQRQPFCFRRGYLPLSQRRESHLWSSEKYHRLQEAPGRSPGKISGFSLGLGKDQGDQPSH